MFKKLLSILFALFVSVGVFAGCNLVQVNNSKYYTQIVATVEYEDKVLEFTMKDLLTAYNNYGYESVQSGNSTVKDAINSTVNSMINRAVLIEELKKSLPLTNAEKMQLLRDVYSNINQTIEQFETQIREKAKLLPTEQTDTTSTYTPIRTPYEEYKPAVKLEDNILVKINYDEEELEEVSDDDYVIEPFVQERNDNVAQEAYKRYISRLRQLAKSEGITGKTDEQLFSDEVARIYKVFEENQYIQKFQKQYSSSENILSISAGDVLERYKALVQRDYALYSANIPAYHAAMRKDASAVYYHPVQNQYVQVTHILVAFSPQQNAKIANLKNQIGKSISQEEFNTALELIKNSTKITYDVYNEETETYEKAAEPITFAAAYEGIVTQVNAKSGIVEKAKEFDKYLYMYNDDPGIMNRDFAYVVNLTNDYGTKDIMIDEFTQVSRALSVGQVSEPVFTEFSTNEFGFHIILNLGVVDNVFSYQNLPQVTINDLFGKTAQPSSNKTLFHVIYDNIVSDKTSVRLGQIASQAKGEVTKYENKYKSLWS